MDLGMAAAEGCDVVLVGCVKTKANEPMPVRDLYVSALFHKRRDHAEATGLPWFVLSSEYGLLAPDTVIAPYDTYLAAQPPEYRQAWGEWVAVNLIRRIGPLAGKTIEVHAGEAYVDGVRVPLERRGARVVAPLRGLRQGEQLAWYDLPRSIAESGPRSPAEQDSVQVEAEPAKPDDHQADQITGVSPAASSGPFTYRWPDQVENFDSGWDITVTAQERTYRVRHGLSRRVVYGRPRRHSVTFVDGQPIVEGVATDDYDATHRLVRARRSLTRCLDL
jgi:hypothetical protein